jgi:rhodanese-related sulfurtransferase
VGVAVLSAGGYGGQLLRRWQRNRYRVDPSAVVKMIEDGKAPILMDTRKADSYEALPLRIPGSVRLAPEELASGAAVLELDINRPVVAYCT